jgi:D-alanyl-D-alanine carboxypeptidase
MMSDRVGGGASHGLRWFSFGLAAVVAVVALSSDPANARRRHHHSPKPTYNPPYASIVVDANTGEVLQSTQADSSRHPASLTKVMTLYLLFERLEAGRLNLNTALPISAHASVQSPTKLGLKAGQTIPVETAIMGLVTRSANDAAVVIAEAIGGTESGFAKMMTQKARALGMTRTVYVNASGLPDDDQVTTARDQATLGRAIQERFPRYYRYFSIESFDYHGHPIRNHNHLLGSVEGVDGIKTGYTRDSGFNIMTSMWRGRRHVVAVVMGGRSAGQRDARMRELLADNIMQASTKPATKVFAKASTTGEGEQRLAYAPERPVPSKPLVLHKMAAAEAAAAIEEPAQTAFRAVPQPAPGSTDPIKPLLIKTVSVKPTKSTKGEAPAFTASVPMPMPHPADTSHAAPIKTASVEAKPAAHAERAQPEKVQRSGWMIQVGAFGAEQEARQRLNAAQSRAKRLLGDADPFTETVTKGEKTFYRARFAGLDKHQAEAACRTLKHNDIACLAIKN